MASIAFITVPRERATAAQERNRREGPLAAAWATVLSLAQRKLSTAARRVRREVMGVTGRIELRDGSSEPLARESLVAAPEAALRLLGLSTVLLAAALVALRL